MEIQEILQSLCALPGPSGFTAPVAMRAKELLAPLTDEVTVDRLGNVVAWRRCGKPGAKRLLLDAHLDEIGFIITGYDGDFLRFSAIGGVDPRMLPAQELMILTEPPRYGVVAVKPPHVLKEDEGERALALEDLRIDAGLPAEKLAAAIPIGTPVVYDQGCAALDGGRVCGKALDDRSCFAALVRTLELLDGEALDVDVVILGSNFEETGGEGAAAAAHALAPDYAVAVDVTFGIQPGVDADKAFPLGGGPVIGVGPNMARWMTRRMQDLARDLSMETQLEVMAGSTGTNGWEIQIAREGIATQVLSLPLRYMHTPGEVIDCGDVEQTARLLAEFVRSLGKEGAPC